MCDVMPQHAYLESVPDCDSNNDAGDVNTKVANVSLDHLDDNINGIPMDTRTNAELITHAAAQLNITNEDVIIAVMGLTGVGKSTFIKLLSDTEVIVGHDLNSCTVNVGVHSFYLNDGRRAYLVDTPGFDDRTQTEAEILEKISNFFAATYKMEIKLAGVIYLHRITDIRMSAAMFKNLTMLKKLCGRGCYSKIVLATTMWDIAPDMQRAIQNEAQLGETHDWWGDLAEEGATIMRQDDGVNSAMKIVEHIMSFTEPAVMANQIERVVDNLPLEECESGKVIARELIKQKEEHEKQMQERREYYEQLLREGDAKALDKLAKLEKKHKEKTEEIRRSEIILSQKLDESNEKLQEEIKKHNAELKEARTARAEAGAALETALNALKDFKKEQDEKEKQWKDDRDRDHKAFKESLADERREYARKEAAIRLRVSQAAEKAQDNEIVSRGIWAGLAGVGTMLAGVATLNPMLVGMGATMAAGGGGRTMYKASRG